MASAGGSLLPLKGTAIRLRHPHCSHRHPKQQNEFPGAARAKVADPQRTRAKSNCLNRTIPLSLNTHDRSWLLPGRREGPFVPACTLRALTRPSVGTDSPFVPSLFRKRNSTAQSGHYSITGWSRNGLRMLVIQSRLEITKI